MSKPVDDVYLTWYYERPSYDVEEAVGMLKKFQELDFTHPKQYVYINVFLDMALEKKVGWKCIQILILFFSFFNVGRQCFKCRADAASLIVRIMCVFAGGFVPLDMCNY